MKVIPLVWDTNLDGRYRCMVRRVRTNVGRLIIRDLEEHETLLSETVPLSFDARFGPDVDDVAAWKARCEEVVDG